MVDVDLHRGRAEACGATSPWFAGIVAGMRKLDRSMIFPALAMLAGVLLLMFYALMITLPMWASD